MCLSQVAGMPKICQNDPKRLKVRNKVVMRAAILSQEAISELRSTLRNLAPSELEDVLRDSNFTERVPYGSITKPAAYVHRMAVQTRRCQMEKSTLGFVGCIIFQLNVTRLLADSHVQIRVYSCVISGSLFLQHFCCTIAQVASYPPP